MKIRSANIQDSWGIGHVQVDSYKTAYGGIFPPAYLEQFTVQEQEQDWRNWFSSIVDELLFVAENQTGEIAGYALGRPSTSEVDAYDSELVALHVAKAYRHRGIGRQLIAVTARGLEALGCRSLMLWTPESNAARTWYAKIGGKILAEKDWGGNGFYGVEVKEIAFGWLDIRSLF